MLRPIIVSLCGLLLLAACSAGVATPPYPPVPALQADPMPKPPVTQEPLIWQPGFWDWNGKAYAWTAGQYVPAAGHGSSWMPGWWNLTEGGWHWERAHWVAP